MKIVKAIVLGLPLMLLAACASHDDAYNDGMYDPFEGGNRAMFAVNNALDQAILEPVARGYRYAAPQPARSGVRNAIRHIRTPINLANEILQGDLEGAGNVTVRAVVNTFVGFGGLMDVAGAEGIPYEQEDFGQTLAVWGVDHGPYLVLPILGPSSLRDYVGFGVDTYADPFRIWLDNIGEERWYYTKRAVEVVDMREQLLDVLEDLQNNSIDYYAALRSVYYQRRAAMVADDRGSFAGGTGPEIPDYDEY